MIERHWTAVIASHALIILFKELMSFPFKDLSKTFSLIAPQAKNPITNISQFVSIALPLSP